MVVKSTTKTSKEVTVPMAKKKRPRPLVQVVTCTAAFPRSTKVRVKEDTLPNTTTASGLESQKNLLDWHDTVKQVRNLGMTGMVGQQKRNHIDDQYKQLTGREKKKHQVPLPIVRGIRKKAAAREARLSQEAKDAGIIRATTSSSSSAATKTDERKRQRDSTHRVHGPAPSIGFMKKGVFRVQDKKR